MKIFTLASILIIAVGIKAEAYALNFTPPADAVRKEVVSYLRGEATYSATEVENLRGKCESVTNTNDYTALTARDAEIFKSNCDHAIEILNQRLLEQTSNIASSPTEGGF